MIKISDLACQDSDSRSLKAPRRRRIIRKPEIQSIEFEDVVAEPFAVRKIAARYRLEPHMADLICRLAQIGQEAA